MVRRPFLFLAACFLAQCVFAAATPWKSNPQGEVRLIAAHDTVSGSEDVLLGLQFKPAPEWYLYWKIPGEAGYPPTLTWKKSQGLKDPKILWPEPVRIVLPGPIEEFGYFGETIYPIRAKRGSGPVRIEVDVSYLTCYTSCIPYKYSFTLDLPVSADAKADSDSDALIQAALQKVPSSHLSDQDIMRKAPTVHKDPGGTAPIPSTTTKSLLSILLLALIGGIILNVMPCVLPVLSIKLAGLLQHAGQSSTIVVKSALSSAAGIIVSFLGLALVAAAARAAGHAVGWGIQFQNPIFVTILMVVVLLFALNLWGVFEIQMPLWLGKFATSFGYRESYSAHFVSGLFATLLATPCSAPFLGTAIGFALSQSTPVILMIFAAVGIGMASPYLALAVFPGSIKWLPKPGNWMISLKKVLALLLVATAAWLGWVLYQQQTKADATVAAQGVWETFDEKAISHYVDEGRPVFVDVTADWCVTCKYNERFVLSNPKITQEFKEQNFILMKADWTNRDKAIADYLMKYGRAGIPFYAIYRPGKEPMLLSEFLTVAEVLQALNR